MLLISCAKSVGPAEDKPVQRLHDLSGLASLGGDTFVAVHDAKNPDENSLVRVSILVLPRSLDGLLWKPLRLNFPGGQSSDLESAARIPGTDNVLLVESGDDASRFQRIFLAEVHRNRVRVIGAVEWGSFAKVFNVEGTAVAKTKTGYLFIWAERNSGKQSTKINWTRLKLAPFAIGPDISSVEFELPYDLENSQGNPLYSRPVVGIDLDSTGRIYTVATFDPEGTVPDPDNGPFRSAVFKIGQVIGETIELDREPSLQATVDGLKVESVAVREHDGEIELFIGSDDENYDGTLRRLPPP
jgi:hypothetical protein